MIESEITPFFRIAKLREKALWAIAGRHNFRETLPSKEHRIDSTRTHLNEFLKGPKRSDQLREFMIQAVGKLQLRTKIRNDAVWAVEVVFSLPSSHALDEGAYFSSCLSWTERWCGGASNILSAVIHRDEPAPHMHALILPIVNGRMNGSKLVGHPPVMRARHLSFVRQVAEPFGLKDSRTSAEILSSRDRAAPHLKENRSTSKPMLCSFCNVPLLRNRMPKGVRAESFWQSNLDYKFPTLASWAETPNGAAFLAKCGLAGSTARN